MRELHRQKGVEWDVPKQQGGIRKQAFRAHLLLVSADFPAKGKLTPCAESTSAPRSSHCSDWDSTSPEAYKPFSFLRARDSRGKAISNKWKLRTLAQVMCDLSASSTQAKLKAAGIYKKVYALQPSLMPHADFTTMCPNDIMHGEPDGNLRRSSYRTNTPPHSFSYMTAYLQTYLPTTGSGRGRPLLHASLRRSLLTYLPTPHLTC